MNNMSPDAYPAKLELLEPLGARLICFLRFGQALQPLGER
jgi:hypothetical protein